MTEADRTIRSPWVDPEWARDYGARMWTYVREMYPPGQRLLTAALIYLSLTLLLAKMHLLQPRFDLACTLLGIWDVVALALITRLSDELKDRAIDRELFPGRPLSSGRVRESDIRISLGLVCVLFFSPHLLSGIAVPTAAALLVYSFGMFHYFFLPPRWKSKLLVNFATHNPIIALLLAHLLVLFAGQHGLGPAQIQSPQTLVLVVMYWSLLGAWELARKIRYPEEETAYQTYSQVFGSTGAVVAALGVQTLALAAGLYLGTRLAVTAAYPLLLVAAYVMLARSYLRFLRRRVSTGKSLRRAAEWYAGLVMLAGLIEFTLIPVIAHVLW
jgi:4-hydroxybenzoate polyprenyltransferase